MKRPDGWTFKQEVKMLRSQMLVHSCIYYRMDESLITDHEWQDRAFRLAKLQTQAITKAGHCRIGFFDREFQDWDGSSGFHLPLGNLWVVGKAQQLMRMKCTQDTKQEASRSCSAI